MKLINIYSLFFEADQVGKPMQKFLFTTLSNLWNLFNHCIYMLISRRRHLSSNIFQLIFNSNLFWINIAKKGFPVLYYMRNNNNLGYHFPAYIILLDMLSNPDKLVSLTLYIQMEKQEKLSD